MKSGGPTDERDASGVERGEEHEWGGVSPSQSFNQSGERGELPHRAIGRALVEDAFSGFWKHGTHLVGKTVTCHLSVSVTGQ